MTFGIIWKACAEVAMRNIIREKGRTMLKVETWSIEKLIPYARNPRKNDEQVDRMVSAIKEFGFRIPVVAKSDGSVVDGHLRLKAAQKLGMTEVPVALADELTDAQVKAFRLLANKSANWAQWDDDLLKLELQDLQDMSYDLELTGFDEKELGSICDCEEKADEKEQEYNEKFNVIIECEDELEQERYYKEFTERGIKCRIQSL